LLKEGVQHVHIREEGFGTIDLVLSKPEDCDQILIENLVSSQ